MHRPATEVPPFLLVRLPIIAIKPILIIPPTIGAAPAVMPLLDIKAAGVAGVPVRERLHPVGESGGAVTGWRCRCPTLCSALRWVGAMLPRRSESWRRWRVASSCSSASSASSTSAASIAASSLEIVGHASHGLLLVGGELGGRTTLRLLLRRVLHLLCSLHIVPNVWALWAGRPLIVVVVVVASPPET